MRNVRRLAATLAATALLMTAGLTTAHADTTNKSATFRGGSGLYLLGGTDGKSRPNGTVTITDSTGGQLTASGHVTGLPKNTPVVAVPYTDPYCTPVPGVTAYPSGPILTDSTGTAHFAGVPVNPAAINPVGQLRATDVHSVSFRQLLVSAVPITIGDITVPAGVPYTSTPNIPNVLLVEGCVTRLR